MLDAYFRRTDVEQAIVFHVAMRFELLLELDLLVYTDLPVALADIQFQF